jgi:hypothetical protein
MRRTSRLILASFLVGQALLLAASATVPAPESVFGFKPGADDRLATYDQAIAYFRKLASSSQHVRLMEAGRTSQGRTMYFALISDPKNLAALERYREIAFRLAHPDGLTDDEARKLAREGRAFVHLDGGCHATEVAGAQMIPQLAYDLLTRTDDPDIRQILDNDIVVLWPTMNPDGQQMVAEWQAKNLGTPYAQSGLPRLYQEYVGHDNNRDAYMMNMIESRVLEHFWRQWEPNIVYVFHQTAPFPTRIWLPPFSEPVGLHAPYLVSREVNMIGMAIAKGLEERGQVGATHMGTSFDAWYPGYVDYAPVFKNIPAFWTETAGNMAAPREYSLDGRRAGGGWPTPSPTTRRRRSPRSSSPPSTRTRSSTTGTRPVATRLPGGRRRRRSRTSCPRNSAIRSPPSRCCAGSRSAASAYRSSRHRSRWTVWRTRPARGWYRRTRSSPPWRASCSTSRSTRTCGSTRAARRSGPTTPPAGRCRCRWASRSRPPRRRSPRTCGPR